MAGASEQQDAATAVAASTTKEDSAPSRASTSPSRSDKSSDSEGRPVREKLKETRIDVKATTGPSSTTDQPMNDVPNGSANTVDTSTSGSDSERGRLRRKRSREDFEEEHESDKQPEKKVDAAHERHARKKSRDVTKGIGSSIPTKPATATTPTIEELDAEMVSPNKNASDSRMYSEAPSVSTSPKNKRTRDQREADTEAPTQDAKGPAANGKIVENGGEERDSKRPRDRDGSEVGADTAKPKTKTPLGSGFANTSASSPFATMSSKSQASKISDQPDAVVQTSDEKFKSSAFGGFASSAASPFSGLAGSKTSSGSPFGGTVGNRLSSFAGGAGTSTSTGSGFSALASSTKPAFGGNSFGSSSGSGFANLAKSNPSKTFGTPGNLNITGLDPSKKEFGAAMDKKPSDDGDHEGSDVEKDGSDEVRRPSQALLSQQSHETGEEGETTVWTGRVRLYTMAGEPSARAWKERGVGAFKFNVSVDEPKRARFVLRADGTHRLLLNAAVTKNMIFGEDAQGAKPKDKRLLFNEPTGNGAVEMHLLKLANESAIKLWEEVSNVQESEL